MNTTTRNLLSALLATLVCAATVSATALHDWQFNDPAGTTMSATLNQGSAGVAWDGNLANSATTGSGIFRIQRSGNLVSRRADVGGTGAATHVYMVAEIAGWNMAAINESVTTELRWELLNGTTLNASTQVTAAFRMFFLTNGQVTLETGAGGTGATRREAEPVFTLTQTEPVTIALAYNMIQQTYVVQYRVGAGSWIEFFNGDVAPDRMPTSFRFAVRGDFDGEGQNYFDLDRFVISTDFPPPDQDPPPPPPEPFFGNLHEWRFWEPAGTALSGTYNSANPDVRWDGNLSNSSTTGSGSFRIQRNGLLLNRRVDVGDPRGSDEMHMQVDVGGWDLQNVADPESLPEIRFEFINAPAVDDSTQITAGMRLARTEGGEVTLQATAGGLAAPGGQESEAIPTFTSVQSEPLSLRVSYNRAEHFYSVLYRTGEGPWTVFFTGTTSGVRDAISWRMTARGDFDGDGQNHLDLHRFVIANIFPIAENAWEDVEPIFEGGPKPTFFGHIYDTHYPWVLHENSDTWLYIATDTGLPDDGILAYNVNTGEWMWTRPDLQGAFYVIGPDQRITWLER